MKSFDQDLEVFSAGTKPSKQVHPKAIEVMKELDIDLNENRPESVDEYIDRSFDYVITVCGGAKESCPAFSGKVKHRLHIGFDDPADVTGTDEEILEEFRRVRDEIGRDFFSFYMEEL